MAVTTKTPERALRAEVESVLNVLKNVALISTEHKRRDSTQLIFTCSSSTIETLKKVLNMFIVNNKNTRTTSE